MTLPSGASAFFPPNMPAFWNGNQSNGGSANMPTGSSTLASQMAFLQNGLGPNVQNPQQIREYMNQLHALAVATQQVPHAQQQTILNGLSLNPPGGMPPPPPLPLTQQPPRSLNQHAQPAQLPPHNGHMGNGSGGPISPTFPSFVPVPSPPAGFDTTTGVGMVTWLSSQAGLIQSAPHGTISFQLKEFCDQAVSDLTTVIRPGFRLKYQAVSRMSELGQQINATFIVPVHGPDAHRELPNLQADLQLSGETGPPQLAKDPYDLELESRAVPMLLAIFERMSVTQCQLGSFHCQISNCGDDNLYKYVGTSSLKRRQFLERRTHLFNINQQDLVSLQQPSIYTTCVCLHAFLLARGGACLMQECFEHFNSCPEIPLEARDIIGEGKTAFLRFLTSHQWLFAVFPSRVFVSVRRQLPEFDYASFINEHFPEMETSGAGGGGSTTRGSPLGAQPQKWPSASAAQSKHDRIEQANTASKLHGSHGSTSSAYGSGMSSSGALSPASFGGNGAPTTTAGGNSAAQQQHLQRSNSGSTPGTPLWSNGNGGQNSPLTGFMGNSAAVIPENSVPASTNITRAPSATPIGKLPDLYSAANHQQQQQATVTSTVVDGMQQQQVVSSTGHGNWMHPGHAANANGQQNVGGRIRRFADMHCQTEPMAPQQPQPPVQRTIGTQTSLVARGVSCGTDTDQIDITEIHGVCDFEVVNNAAGAVGAQRSRSTEPQFNDTMLPTPLPSLMPASSSQQQRAIGPPPGLHSNGHGNDEGGSPNSNYDPFASGLQFNNLMSAFGSLSFK